MIKSDITPIMASFLAKTGRLLAHEVPLLQAIQVFHSQKDVPTDFLTLIDAIIHSVELGYNFSNSLEMLNFMPESIITAIRLAEQKGILDEKLPAIAQLLIDEAVQINLPDKVSGVSQEISVKADELEQTVDALLKKAAESGTSDIHIEPTAEGGVIRARHDGVLHLTSHSFNREEYSLLIQKIKLKTKLDPAERKLPQNGRFTLEISSKSGDDLKKIAALVSICPFLHGEKAVIRFLDSSNFPTELRQVMSGNDLETAERWLKRAYGIILVCGPSGTGKTTTLYLMLEKIARNEGVNAVSIEDPIEYVLPRVHQFRLDPMSGLDFPEALKAILRQDIDVVAVGEIREPKTAVLLSKIALTGHLVLSQLHTRNGIDAIRLFLELGVPHYILRQVLIGVVAQRLVRRLCPLCAIPIPEDAYAKLPALYHDLGREQKIAIGCDSCGFTGYKGRLAIYEMFEPHEEFWEQLALQESKLAFLNDYEKRHAGILEAGLTIIIEGKTSWKEIERVRAL